MRCVCVLYCSLMCSWSDIAFFRRVDVVCLCCVDPIDVPNSAFCVVLLMFVNDARGDHMDKVYSAL